MDTSKLEAVKRWRKNTKERIIESMGGECVCCGYKKSTAALELHHIEPLEKEFAISSVLANCISWKRIVDELRKCVLVCSNCHKEIHFCDRDLPEKYITFDESFSDYKLLEKEDQMDECPVCFGKKLKKQQTCSLSCAGKLRGKVDWDSVNLSEMLKKHKSYEAVGRELGVTGASVKKRFCKLMGNAPGETCLTVNQE